MRRVLRLALILGALLLAALPSSAFAIANPDSFSIVSAYGYGGVLETGDILVIIRYDVEYGTLPTETASQSVLGRYFDASASLYRREAAPFVYVNSGYGQGVISLYFTATQASGFSITHTDADSAEVSGNPSLFASPWKVLTPITWRTLGSQSQLETDVANIGLELEEQSEWATVSLVQAVSGTNKLTADGEDYFTNAIPNLQQMAPGIFTAALVSADFIERDFTQSYQTTLENTFAGTRFENIFANAADWLNIPEVALKTVLWLGVAFAAGTGVMVWAVKRGVPESAAGSALFLVAAVVVSLAARVGWFSLQMYAIIGFMGLLMLTFVLFLKRA